jgi:hypothetical protein
VSWECCRDAIAWIVPASDGYRFRRVPYMLGYDRH